MDEANPQGMPRPRLATKKVYQDDPKTSRPMLPIRQRNRGGGIDIYGRGYGSMAKDPDPTPAQGTPRPSLPTMTGTPSTPSTADRQRPSLKLKTQDEIWGDPQKPGTPYDQAKDPDCNCTGPDCSCG